MTILEINALTEEQVNKEVIKRVMGGKRANYVGSMDAAWLIIDRMRAFDIGESEDANRFNPSIWHEFEVELRYQIAGERTDENRKKVFSMLPIQFLRGLSPLAISRAALCTAWAFGDENKFRYPKTEQRIQLLRGDA